MSRTRTWITIMLVLAQLGGCAAWGPLITDPDRHLSGLKDIVADLPAGGTLNIILVHGMRADKTLSFVDLQTQIHDRLQLGALESSDHKALIATAPAAFIEHEPLFEAGTWDSLRPTLSLERFSKRLGDRLVHVNFFRFEYWQALAYIKCRYVIATDAAIIGPTARSQYCAQTVTGLRIPDRLSGKPELANRWLKAEIVEWGLSDAIIPTSAYRAVLHQAVGEALEETTREAFAEPAALAAPTPAAVPGPFRQRFAFVTESLGSYVISEALLALQSGAAATDPSGRSAAESPAHSRQRRAVELAVCGATQVHMLANQLALLRLSEISIDGAASPPPEWRQHFFAGCPAGQAQEQRERGGVQYGARQIVAYHEPNDLLSFYTSDRPGAPATDNRDTTNVVKPYATVWLPFVIADPIKAHTGQSQVAAVMDVLVCGHEPGRSHPCRGAR